MVVCPCGDIDAAGAPTFRQVLAGLEDYDTLVIDFSGVEFMDSAGLGALVGVVRHNAGADRQTVIMRARPGLRSVLHDAGLESLVFFQEDPASFGARHGTRARARARDDGSSDSEPTKVGCGGYPSRMT